MAQSILVNTSIASSGRIIAVFLGVFITALITRLLGPQNYGSYILLLSYGAIIQLLADGGLYLTLTRSIAEEPNKKGETISHIFSLRLILLSISFILGLFLIQFLPSFKGLIPIFIIMSVGLSFQSLSQLLMGIFQHYQVVWRATVGDIIARLTQLLGIVVVGFYGATTQRIMSVFTISLASAYIVHQMLLPRIKWRPIINLNAYKTIITSSWPLGTMLLLNAIYFRADIIMISIFNTPTQVGTYGVAFRIMESALFFPAMFGGLLLPRLSEAIAQKKIHVVQNYIKEGLILMSIASAFCLLIILTKSREIIYLISGQEFISATPLLRVLGLALAIIFFGNIFGFTLVAMKKQYYLILIYVVLVGTNALANLFAIPFFGPLGAAWSTVITELLSATTAGILVLKTYPINIPKQFIIKLLIITFITGVSLSLMSPKINVTAQIIIGLLIFILGIRYTHIISRNQFTLLNKINDL